MGHIVILDENTSNQIAAGEVVERPSSVVKELVENSIDAGSTNILVEISKGGISLIKVSDNGSGIQEDDVEIAFERHATSKIRNSYDLESILTLGFRGEALASIASVSVVELTTRVKNKPCGMYIRIRGGIVEETNQAGCPVGTTFIVKELFFNTPARFKFLKKDTTEAGYISDIVNRIALGNPHISFKLINNKNSVLHTPGNNDLLSTIFSLYGKETSRECLEVLYEDDKFKITGYAGKPSIARSNRNWQSIYLNGRYIKNKVISAAIDEAYKTFLLKNKFAFIVLNITVNPMLVDVNVHPTKMEVRFSNEQDIFRAVYHALNNALLSKSLVKNADLLEKKNNIFKFEENIKETDYVQQKMKTSFDMEASRKIDTENKTLEFAKSTSGFYNEYKNTQSLCDDEIEVNSKSDEYIDTTIVKKEEVEKLCQPQILESKNVETKISQKEVESISFKKVNEEKEDNHIEKPDDEVNKDILVDSTIIGQVFSTYIILQNGENLILIDQHAAHERIVFENLKKKYYNKENLSQYLLSPVVLELTYQEISFIKEHNETLNKLGFIIESFGNNSVIIRTVPLLNELDSIKEVFLEILDLLMSKTKKDNICIEEEALYKMACKSAVKANVKLDKVGIGNILKELSQINNPYTCPHGRPTIIKITKYELEKMFKRIV
ncbi:UNVERIFIED_CONTAM: DNA mismatch repair protein MutL [Acetivibrio alkalicellulosi]